MKRLTNLRNSPSDSPQTRGKKSHIQPFTKSKKVPEVKSNPYPESGHVQNHRQSVSSDEPRATSVSTGVPGTNGSYPSLIEEHHASNRPVTVSNKSAAPTVATNPDTVHSDTGQSKAGTSNTVGGCVSTRTVGENSTFSSPNHSERSLTTTLTTVQSTAPSAMLNQQQPAQTVSAHSSIGPNPSQFSHQFPISPASAIPTHLSQQSNPMTYNTATANNMLTDNASIMTLASSTKRRRRNSLDTDASIRALAPSSVWGGSRESLPLSVLSGNVESPAGIAAGGLYQSQNRPSVGGLASAERASVYSSSGVGPPALNSERNSYYAGKQGVENMSVRSGLLGHGRAESLSGSIGGVAAPSSPLVSPRDTAYPDKPSRRDSEKKEMVLQEAGQLQSGKENVELKVT